MSRSPFRRIALVALTATTVLAGVAVPAQAVDTGTISGRFTSNGEPIANARVSAFGELGNGSGHATTNSAGEYQISGLPPNTYRMSFGGVDLPTQWAYGKADFGAATPIQVSAGTVTTVDEQALPTGTISGTYRLADGSAPANSVQVAFWPAGPGASYMTAFLDSGRFSARVLPGKYRIWFTINSYPDLSAGPFIQYAGGTDISNDATVFDVAAGAEVTVTETMLPNGRMAGRFTDAAGNGIPNVEVSISRTDLGRGPSAHTDANGNYSFPRMWARAGWRVQFNGYGQQQFRQYAFGKLREADANLITITEGQTTAVSDSLLPTGSVRVLAKDAATGQPIDAFSGYLDTAGYGDSQNGVLVMQDVPIGTQSLTVNAYGYHDHLNGTTVTVTAGAQTEVTVTLQSKSRIETTVVDAVTGEPVAGVCLISAKAQQVSLPGDGCNIMGQISSTSGRVLVETSGAGWFQVLALPIDAQGYGAQWVGANGGTGSQLGAQLIKVEADKASKAPTIKLDRAGTVTGKVTTATGAPVANGYVSLADFSSAGGPGHGTTSTDEEGNYTVDFLGPYQWPLRFQTDSGEIQWSGQTGNRHLAQTVTVLSGQSTTYDFTFKPAVQVSIKVTGVSGVFGGCYFHVHNAISGDVVGMGFVDDCTQSTVIPVVGPQVVKIRVGYLDGEQWRERWYGGSSLNTAKPVILPSNGSKTVVIPV